MNTKKYFRYAILFVVYGAFALLFWPFIEAIILAILFSFGLNPLLTKLKKRFKIKDFWAISVLVLGIVGILFLPLSIIIIRIAANVGKINADKLTELPIIEKSQYLLHKLAEQAGSISETFGIDVAQFDVQSVVANFGKTVLAVATAILANIPSFIFQFLIFIALLYYFLMNQKRLKKNFMNTDLLTSAQLQKLVRVFEDVCYTVLISTVLIAILQSGIVAITYALVGYKDALVVFMIGFFMAFVPVIGAAPLSIILIIYSFLSGNYGAAIAFVVAGSIAGTVDNLIKSYIFSSKKDSVSPLITLLAIIGAVSLFGAIGLFLGPIIPELAVQIGNIMSDDESESEATEKA